jgi:hypothetical protein
LEAQTQGRVDKTGRSANLGNRKKREKNFLKNNTFIIVPNTLHLPPVPYMFLLKDPLSEYIIGYDLWQKFKLGAMMATTV